MSLRVVVIVCLPCLLRSACAVDLSVVCLRRLSVLPVWFTRSSINLSVCLSELVTLRLLLGSWALWGRVSALGTRVRDLTTRVLEPEGSV